MVETWKALSMSALLLENSNNKMKSMGTVMILKLRIYTPRTLSHPLPRNLLMHSDTLTPIPLRHHGRCKTQLNSSLESQQNNFLPTVEL